MGARSPSKAGSLVVRLSLKFIILCGYFESGNYQTAVPLAGDLTVRPLMETAMPDKDFRQRLGKWNVDKK